MGLFKITSAAITPGTQPQMVSRVTMRNEPHPLSHTANGGKIIDNNTLIKDILICFYIIHSVNKFMYQEFITLYKEPVYTYLKNI